MWGTESEERHVQTFCLIARFINTDTSHSTLRYLLAKINAPWRSARIKKSYKITTGTRQHQRVSRFLNTPGVANGTGALDF